VVKVAGLVRIAAFAVVLSGCTSTEPTATSVGLTKTVRPQLCIGSYIGPPTAGMDCYTGVSPKMLAGLTTSECVQITFVTHGNNRIVRSVRGVWGSKHPSECPI
jgi:hypothetical protein